MYPTPLYPTSKCVSEYVVNLPPQTAHTESE